MDEKKQIVIIGAGISGLTAAYYHAKSFPNDQIILLEKGEKAGGWMETFSIEGMLFEKGPRIFKASRSEALLALVDELGLQNELTASSKSAKGRYILYHNKLHKVPSDPLSMLLSPLTRPLVLALFTEWRKKPSDVRDESIYAFVKRRFNQKTADRLFDPLTKGIFGGDPKELSVKACFGILKMWEEQYGSLTKAFFKQIGKKKKAQSSSSVDPRALFTLQNGVSSLIQALIEKTKAHLFFGQKVESLIPKNNQVEVITSTGSFLADELYIATPVEEAARLMSFLEPKISEALSRISTISLTSVLVGFKKEVLTHRGFGYLVPSSEHSPLLGVVFDSDTFPAQNRSESQTRLTIKLKGVDYTEEEVLSHVQRALKEHLHIQEKPDVYSVCFSKSALPQYGVGHDDIVEEIEKKLASHPIHCHLLGNYMTGVSVNDCIVRSKISVEKLKSALPEPSLL